MTRLRIFTLAAAAAMATALLPQQAGANGSGVAWGTTGSGGTNGRAMESASLHQIEGRTAQIVTAGRNITNMYRSISSCGVCVTYSIEGDRNSINSNSVTGSNAGTVSTTGAIGDE